MNRTTLTLGGAVTALAAITGVAAVAAPGEESTGSAERKPVERSTLVCPQPSTSDVAETTYTAFSPKGASGGKGGAALYPAELADTEDGDGEDGESGDSGERDEGGEGRGGSGAGGGKPVISLKSPGAPVTATTDESDAPALAGSADGRFAPGWTAQQTTEVGAGAGRGLQGTACSVPDTSMWFPGASTADERQDYIHLTNPDRTAAVVDLKLYGKDGKEASTSGEGIAVPPRSTVPVLLSTLTKKSVTNVAVQVAARSGRVGAQVQAVDEEQGGDWLPPAADAAPSAVLPGIPADATSVRLVAFAPGEDDADLSVKLAGPSGKIVPAGNETLHVKGGRTTAVDLRNLTQGEAGSLVLTPSDSEDKTPVVVAARVTRGKGEKRETAFIPSTAPLKDRATAADNRAKGSTLSLTAPQKTAKVRVTASAGSERAGKPRSRTVTVKGGTTKAFAPPKPSGGKGGYAVTVERVSGGPVHASRMLEKKKGGVPMFTVQHLPDDGSTVEVPSSGEDLSVLTDDG